jgi:hypothetical protein
MYALRGHILTQDGQQIRTMNADPWGVELTDNPALGNQLTPPGPDLNRSYHLAPPQHFFEQAQFAKDVRGVWPNTHTRAYFPQFMGFLENLNLESVLEKRVGSTQASQTTSRD